MEVLWTRSASTAPTEVGCHLLGRRPSTLRGVGVTRDGASRRRIGAHGVTTVDEPQLADDAPTPQAEPPRRGGRHLAAARRHVVRPRTLVLLLVIGGITLISVFTFSPIASQNGLIRDRAAGSSTSAGARPRAPCRWSTSSTGGTPEGGGSARCSTGWLTVAPTSSRSCSSTSSAGCSLSPYWRPRSGGCGAPPRSSRWSGSAVPCGPRRRRPTASTPSPRCGCSPCCPPPASGLAPADRPRDPRDRRIRHAVAPRRAGGAVVRGRRVLRTVRQPARPAGSPDPACGCAGRGRRGGRRLRVRVLRGARRGALDGQQLRVRRTDQRVPPTVRLVDDRSVLAGRCAVPAPGDGAVRSRPVAPRCARDPAGRLSLGGDRHRGDPPPRPPAPRRRVDLVRVHRRLAGRRRSPGPKAGRACLAAALRWA